MNTKIIIGGLVLVVIAFYGGMKYSESKRVAIIANFRNGNFTPGQGGGRGLTGGGAISGEIISKDPNGITIKMRDGSSKIVILSSSTSVMKSVNGTLTDLEIGKEISGTGTANSDGSLTASMIQIRQATTTTNK